MWNSNLEKTFISLHILYQHPIALPVRLNPEHKKLLTVLSHFRTSVSTSSSSTKHLPPSWFLSGPKRWKSLGAKSGLYGGCSWSSRCSCWILSWVAVAVWGLALFDEAVPLLSVGLDVVCELHPEASTQLHSTMQNSHFHRACENGLAVLRIPKPYQLMA
jgi:hypothetical protein